MYFIKSALFLGILLSSISPAWAVQPHQYPGWTLDWVDNFDNNQLDRQRWRIGYPWNSRTHNHNGYAEEANIQIRDGNLYLYAGGGRTGDRYNTGVISTQDLIRINGDEEWLIEARMQLANRNGIWPAFWLNSTGPWPNINEIDIMEQKGWGSQNIYESVMHFAVNSGGRPSQHRTVRQSGNNLDTNWHRYGVAIKNNEVKIMFDSNTVNRVTGARKDLLRSKPYYLILNSAIGGAWGGNSYQNWIDNYQVRSRYIIDYVAVYRKNAGNSGGGGSGGGDNQCPASYPVFSASCNRCFVDANQAQSANCPI